MWTHEYPLYTVCTECKLHNTFVQWVYSMWTHEYPLYTVCTVCKLLNTSVQWLNSIWTTKHVQWVYRIGLGWFGKK